MSDEPAARGATNDAGKPAAEPLATPTDYAWLLASTIAVPQLSGRGRRQRTIVMHEGIAAWWRTGKSFASGLDGPVADQGILDPYRVPLAPVGGQWVGVASPDDGMRDDGCSRGPAVIR